MAGVGHNAPEINYVAVSGKVLSRKNLERTRSGAWLLELQLENVVSTEPRPGQSVREIVSVLGVEVWGDQARKLDRRVQVKSQLLVEGYASSRAFEDRAGVVHYRMVIKAARVQVLDAPD